MTLSKLAQLANVSVSVVSKAFSGRSDVSDAMREHVFAVAREHGCFRQFYHTPYDKPVIAVIIPEAISEYYIHYMQVLKESMEKSGYTMLLSISNFDPQMKEELVRYYTEHSKVDALILFGAPSSIGVGVNTRMIVIGKYHEGDVGDVFVTPSLENGLHQALSALVEKGHRRIAYVGEAFTVSKAQLMSEMLDALGVPSDPSYIISSRSRFAAAGEDGVTRLWAISEKPTAIVGAYGYITKGILSALEARGISVPRDVAVVSMDSDPSPLHAVLDVSCVPSGIEEVCDGVIKALDALVNGKNIPREIVIPTCFHTGETI